MIYNVGILPTEPWTLRGAVPVGEDEVALKAAFTALTVRAAQLHDQAARAGAGPEVLRESEACAREAAVIRAMLDRRAR